MNLSETTWTDADNYDGNLAVLPVGSTEQHGPHAPLGTDAIAAEAVAAEGVKRASRRAVVAPTFPFGVAAEHRQFTGTLWLSEDTFRSAVRETIESLASHGWNRVIVVNGHGGNVPALREVCGRLVREEVCYAVPFTWFEAVDLDSIDGFAGEMGHGGPVETSLIRANRPELVHEDRFDRASEDGATRWGEWAGSVNLAFDTAEFSESGVVGNPDRSSEAVGEQLLASAGETLADLLDTVVERDVTRPGHV